MANFSKFEGMHDTTVRAPSHELLFEVAAEQMGYFTAAQAQECGFDGNLLAYHSGTGRFAHIQRGIYRLRDFPFSMYEEVMVAWLAVGKESAVVSHESALEILNLSDNIPSAIHLTVPRSMRYRTPPPGVALHTTVHPLLPRDVIRRESMRITSAARSIVDSAALGIDPKQVEMAVQQALARGIAFADELQRLAKPHDAYTRNLIERAIDLAVV